jgi:hypothetical protein
VILATNVIPFTSLFRSIIEFNELCNYPQINNPVEFLKCRSDLSSCEAIRLVHSPLPQLFLVEMMRWSCYCLFINQPVSIFVLCVEGKQARVDGVIDG